MKLALILFISLICLATVASVSAVNYVPINGELSIVEDHPRLLKTKDDFIALESLIANNVSGLGDNYDDLVGYANTCDAVPGGESYVHTVFDTSFYSCAPLVALVYQVETIAGRDGSFYLNKAKQGLDFNTWSGILTYDWIYEGLTQGERDTYNDQLGAMIAVDPVDDDSFPVGYLYPPQEQFYRWLNTMYFWKALVIMNEPNLNPYYNDLALSYIETGQIHLNNQVQWMNAAEYWPEGRNGYESWDGHGIAFHFVYDAYEKALIGDSMYAKIDTKSYLKSAGMDTMYSSLPYMHGYFFTTPFADSGPMQWSSQPSIFWISSNIFDDEAYQLWLEKMFYDTNPPGTERSKQLETFFRVAFFKPENEITVNDLDKFYVADGGHAYYRSSWDDPDATWSMLEVDDHFAGHSHDSHGSFFIAKKTPLVNVYSGGGMHLLIGDIGFMEYTARTVSHNTLLIHDPNEIVGYGAGSPTIENDGGQLAYHYNEYFKDVVDVISNYNDDYSYVWSDLTRAYSSKVNQVEREFIVLPSVDGEDDYFIVFDKVNSVNPNFEKTFLLNVIDEPFSLDGSFTQLVGPAGSGVYETTDTTHLDFVGNVPYTDWYDSTGKSKMYINVLEPSSPKIIKRGGDDRELISNINLGSTPVAPTLQPVGADRLFVSYYSNYGVPPSTITIVGFDELGQPATEVVNACCDPGAPTEWTHEYKTDTTYTRFSSVTSVSANPPVSEFFLVQGYKAWGNPHSDPGMEESPTSNYYHGVVGPCFEGDHYSCLTASFNQEGWRLEIEPQTAITLIISLL